MTNNLRKKTQSSRTMPFQLLTLILKMLVLNPQHNNYYVRTKLHNFFNPFTSSFVASRTLIATPPLLARG